MANIHLNVIECRRCFKKHGRAWPSGVVVACHQSGRPLFSEHVAAHECPLGRFKARGLGDTVARVLAATGIARLFKGKGCGCGQRQASLNRIVPYGPREKTLGGG